MKTDWKMKGIFLVGITCSVMIGQDMLTPDSVDFYAIDSVEQHVENRILQYLQEEYVDLDKAPVVLDVHYECNFKDKTFHYSIVQEKELTANTIISEFFKRYEIEISGDWDFLSYVDNLLTLQLNGECATTIREFDESYGLVTMSHDGKFIYTSPTIFTADGVMKVRLYAVAWDRDLYTIGTLRQLTYIDLQYLSLDELAYLRNEFYARKGYIFKTARMKNYFKDKKWYEPQYNDVSHLLSDLELKNIYFIKSIEEGERLYEDYSTVSGLFRIGTTRKLTENDLAGLNVHELTYLRNEFYARKGYIFKTQRMKHYFSKMPWYNPRVDNAAGLLSDLEMDNVLFIKEIEEQKK